MLIESLGNTNSTQSWGCLLAQSKLAWWHQSWQLHCHEPALQPDINNVPLHEDRGYRIKYRISNIEHRMLSIFSSSGRASVEPLVRIRTSTPYSRYHYQASQYRVSYHTDRAWATVTLTQSIGRLSTRVTRNTHLIRSTLIVTPHRSCACPYTYPLPKTISVGT